MKILFSYLWLLLPTCSAYLHIEDLRKMVLNNTQRKQLQILAKEVLRPRSVVQQEVALIANNQTEDVQVNSIATNTLTFQVFFKEFFVLFNQQD